VPVLAVEVGIAPQDQLGRGADLLKRPELLSGRASPLGKREGLRERVSWPTWAVWFIVPSATRRRSS
jgi:hypothetical protein